MRRNKYLLVKKEGKLPIKIIGASDDKEEIIMKLFDLYRADIKTSKNLDYAVLDDSSKILCELKTDNGKVVKDTTGDFLK